ncbi:MAG: hypothetical protein QM796_20050 [Chthoniobacteraceae bacterium]
MVDAAIIMVENAHKALERFRHEHGREPHGGERTRVIVQRGKNRRAPALFLTAGDHGEFHPGLLARCAGRAAVQAAWLTRRPFRCSSPRCSR